MILRAARTAGIDSVSDWARGALLAAARPVTIKREVSGVLLKEWLKKGEAIDIAAAGRYVPEDDTYELYGFDEDADCEYWDLAAERGVWSIGRRKADGVVVAAFDTRFYQNPNYECVWLR